MNPLLAIPSVRDIPDVTKWWPDIPYDKYIVRFKLHREAYMDIKEFFSLHTKYDTLIISADDLETPPDKVKMLLDDLTSLNFETISGYCNLDEGNPDTYAVQPLGACDYTKDRPNTAKGAWYSKNEKPIFPSNTGFLEVGFEGFCCQVITRKLFNQITLTGKNNEKVGNFDWVFAQECRKLGIPLMIDTNVKLYHRRQEQYEWVQKFKADTELQKHGNSYLIKN